MLTFRAEKEYFCVSQWNVWLSNLYLLPLVLDFGWYLSSGDTSGSCIYMRYFKYLYHVSTQSPVFMTMILKQK